MRQKLIIILILITMLLQTIIVSAVQTIVTFDEPPISNPPPAIGVRYSNDGIFLPKVSEIISLPTRVLDAKAHSGSNVLISFPTRHEFDPSPLVIDFTYNVQAVTLYTGVPWDTHGERVNIILEGLDENGNRIDMKRTTLIGPTDINTLMQVSDPQKQHTIKQIKIDNSFFEFVDDISLTSEGEPPVLAVEPPSVHIKSPNDGTSTNTDRILIEGEIYGTGLFPEIAPPELEVSWPIAPSSIELPSAKYELILGENLFQVQPNKFEFHLPSFYLNHLGKNTITVTASNAKGAGSDEVSITYMPQAIYKEFTNKGGSNTFGNFVYGDTKSDCTFAIYQNGAIFSSSAGTYSVLGNIYKKWTSLPDSLGRLGCAIGEEKAITGGSAQDFVAGRIYSGPKGEYYVIEPFRDAIDKLDFVKDYGLPVTDPVEQNKPLLPVLWQKFEREIVLLPPLKSITLVSTMEVTDKPLTLWVATPDWKARSELVLC